MSVSALISIIMGIRKHKSLLLVILIKLFTAKEKALFKSMIKTAKYIK